MRDANPLEKVEDQDFSGKQTVEFRCPDGSADVYLLIAGLAVAVRHGFEMKDALQYAKERYVDVNIFDDANKGVADRLSQLPAPVMIPRCVWKNNVLISKSTGCLLPV